MEVAENHEFGGFVLIFARISCQYPSIWAMACVRVPSVRVSARWVDLTVWVSAVANAPIEIDEIQNLNKYYAVKPLLNGGFCRD